MTETPIEPNDSLSILNTTKKNLGIDSRYDVFDLDILTHINSVLFTLNQLGVGPVDGFRVEDANTSWDDYLGTDDKNLSAVKSYMYLRVRLLFDPPTTSFAIDAMKKQAEEFEWRLNVHVENLTPDPQTTI